MSHHCIDWIPSNIGNNLSIMWTLDFGVPEYDYPKVWIEHGIPDNHVTEKKQFYKDIYYLCSNDYTYSILKNEGLKAFHVGHIFLDKTIPDRRNPELFVYAPQHCRFEEHNLPTDWNQEPLTRKELENLTFKYGCSSFITSIVDDTQRDLYSDLNPMMSNRYHGMGISHYKKCKYLYESAKVIYTDIMSTFDIAAEAHGIQIIGRDKQKMPRSYDKINVLVDGESCSRIIDICERIIKGEL